MFSRRNKTKIFKSNIIYTFVASVLLCCIFLFTINYIYQKAEDESYEYLHMQTKQIKEDLHLQIISDRENLITMASFAAKFYDGDKDFQLLFDSFEPIGLVENIGILLPDNTFLTKMGSINIGDALSFSEEIKKVSIQAAG